MLYAHIVDLSCSILGGLLRVIRLQYASRYRGISLNLYNLFQGSRLVLVLHGRPNNAMGICREGTELWVNPSRRVNTCPLNEGDGEGDDVCIT